MDKVLHCFIDSNVPYFRGCKRVWMAAYRGLYKSRSLLSLWDSSCCLVGFLVKFRRHGPLDWNSNRCLHSNNFTLYCHELHKLGKTGVLFNLVHLHGLILLWISPLLLINHRKKKSLVWNGIVFDTVHKSLFLFIYILSYDDCIYSVFCFFKSCSAGNTFVLGGFVLQARMARERIFEGHDNGLMWFERYDQWSSFAMY
jgi:hypothetical protein